MALDRAKVVADIGLTADLHYVVVVDFFDSANPAAILWEETFKLSRPATTTQLQAAVVARGQELRQAFSDRDAARVAVPINTTVPIP